MRDIEDKIKIWIPSLILIPIIIWLTYNNGRFIFFLDHFNLLLHEGGHGVFKIFGGFVYTLGGTLMQIIIPGLFIYYFVSNNKKLGTQISLLWLGENFLNISVYASDARAKKLPLLGGNKVYHDWEYLLRKLNILQYDLEVGYFFVSLSIITFIICLLIPLIMKEYKTTNIDLKL